MVLWMMCRWSCATYVDELTFCYYATVDHRNLHVLTHSFPTRRASDLRAERVARVGRPAPQRRVEEGFVDRGRGANQGAHLADQIGGIGRETGQRVPPGDGPAGHGEKRRAMWTATIPPLRQIGRATCRERVCQPGRARVWPCNIKK